MNTEAMPESVDFTPANIPAPVADGNASIEVHMTKTLEAIPGTPLEAPGASTATEGGNTPAAEEKVPKLNRRQRRGLMAAMRKGQPYRA